MSMNGKWMVHNGKGLEGEWEIMGNDWKWMVANGNWLGNE